MFVSPLHSLPDSLSGVRQVWSKLAFAMRSLVALTLVLEAVARYIYFSHLTLFSLF